MTLIVLCAAMLSGLAGVASASELNISGTWNANYHCEVGWCAGEDFPAPGIVYVQAPGSDVVYNGSGGLVGTLKGNELVVHGGSPGEYQFDQTQIFSADGDSWTGPLSDSNGTSGTDTGVRVSGGPPAEETAKQREENEARKKTEENEAREKSKRASTTTDSCYVPLVAPYAAWECTVTVADASGSQPPATPTGSVAFSVNSGFDGSFVGARECALKPSQSGPTAYCTVLFVPAVEVPIGAPAPITASYAGSTTFRASASSAQSTSVYEEPSTPQTDCGSAQAASLHFAALTSPFSRAFVAATAPASTRAIMVGNPKLARKQRPLGRAAAIRRAVAILDPAKASRRTGVRLYGLHKPLAAGSSVTEATLGLGRAIVKPLKLGERSWLFWEDLQPLAGYEHPSVVLLVSASGGRVLARAPFVTYPEVNGKVPAFASAGARSELVYGRNSTVRHKRRLTKAQLAALVAASEYARTAVHAGRHAHKADVSHSTLITLVDHVSGGKGDTFENEESAVTYAFAQHGVATQGVLTTNELSTAVQRAAASGQTNITVFLDGHGGSTQATALPTVGLGEGAGEVTSADLSAIVKAHPDVQFNFIIDSCYSGRFVDPLKAEANVGAVLTSSSSKEISLEPLQLEYEGGPTSASNGRGLVIKNGPTEGYGGLVVGGQTKESGKPEVTLKTPDGERLMVSKDDSHEGISPFSTGVIAALNQAFAGKGADADLTDVLTDARTLEPTYDLAATAGMTTPSPEPTAPAPQFCSVRPPAETASGGWFTGGE